MYDFPISTPANTTKAAPQRTLLTLHAGVIEQVHVAFPPGPQGLLHVQLERGGNPLWPNNQDDGFAWDDYTIIFAPAYELSAAPYHLEAITWNLDDTFVHQVTIRVNIVPRELVFPDRAELGILQDITRRLFGRRGGG